MDHAAALRQTVRVGADGTVTRGIDVPHEASNIRGDTRVFASHPKRAALSTFRGHDGVPKDMWLGDRKTNILAVTLPHDCDNHLTGLEETPVIRNAGWAALLKATRPVELAAA